MAVLVRALTAAENAAAWLSTVILAALTLIICVDVFLRYFLNAPLSWGVEISEISLLWITMLGTAWVLRNNGHIRVDLLLNLLPPWATRQCALFSSFVSTISCAILAWFSTDAVLVSIARGTFKPTPHEFPIWLIILPLPVGAALLTLRFARMFFEYLSGERVSETESQM